LRPISTRSASSAPRSAKIGPPAAATPAKAEKKPAAPKAVEKKPALPEKSVPEKIVETLVWVHRRNR